MNGEGRIVLQRVGQALLVPVQGPVTGDGLTALRRVLLAHLEREGARRVVFDLSGIEIMDADDFSRLRQVVQAAVVMGASVILAGIQPGVAAGLVLLDADTSWMTGALTVERALKALGEP